MIPPYRRVLVTTDFSELGNRAIPHAYAVADKPGTVYLCHVIELPRTPNPLYAHYSPGRAFSVEERARLRQGIEQRLKGMVPPEAVGLGVATEVRVVESDEAPYLAICRAADRLDAQVIVMASHGLSGVTHLFLGSVTERVLRSTSRPVLVVRERADA